tara:strand:+ start:144 stop:1259 length:1116 start_codon:yes stop_codon:yes gene_type:complete
MANMNIRTPRFYTDYISYLLSRGVAQDGNFDIKSTNSGNNTLGTFTTGSEAELFDLRPLNLNTIDTSSTSAVRDDHVLINIDKQDTTQKISYIAILNHNLVASEGKIRIFAGNESTDVGAVDGTLADTSDIDWSSVTVTDVINADNINVTATGSSTYDDKSVVIRPNANGSTIITFPETTLRYWGIQFEGSGGGGAETSINGDWSSSTNFSVACIMIGEFFDMPFAPDLSVKRSIIFDGVSEQQSISGQKFANLTTIGKTASSTSKSPFVGSSFSQNIYGGRLAYDLNFSFLNSNQLMPTRYNAVQPSDDVVIEDVWNKTNGNHLPFIFSVDKDNGEESEHMFARFGQNSLDMTQVAPDVFNLALRIEEEF